jgi:hypothetical protein
MNHLIPLSSRPLPVPALVAAAGDRARVRFIEFFAVYPGKCRRAIEYKTHGRTWFR